MDVYIRDRAFPVTRLPAPILVKFDLKATIDRYRGYRKPQKETILQASKLLNHNR